MYNMFIQKIEIINNNLEKTGPISPTYLMKKLKISYDKAMKIIQDLSDKRKK